MTPSLFSGFRKYLCWMMCCEVLALTLCRSTVFMMDPWKKVTVVKCLLIRPSNSSPGGVLNTRHVSCC